MPDFNKDSKLQVIRGAVPSNLNNIKGDAFAVRNDYALGIDFEEESPYYQISTTHFVKSNLLNKNVSKYEPPKIIKRLWDKYENQMNSIYGDDKYVSQKVYDEFVQKAYENNELVKKLIAKREEEKAIKQSTEVKKPGEKNA
ncbi:Uncharacterised protein [Mycoplasmopsis caviae]|uniref:Uncharacterized protein n=1 Tax=Mycoplasmopsis caviae TaxID=55603 RepID=A0A3P8LB07_9BACT|nr:hypothetical protein [Mycoplasmopsis caviae]VDR42141.1 Uncharacterised protein [Mycoplasmopsis caviae]